MDQNIVIRGARQHNLKNIDLTLPRRRFIVITGVSGSGKSSLAFNTLFAEGQRRYVEALSSYARQFLQRLDTPLVDEILGLSPAVAIEQKGLHRTPRSTVGTLTEVHDHLRLLYARLGTSFCPSCGIPIRAYTIPQMVQEIVDDWPEGSRMLVTAPQEPVREQDLPKFLKRLRKDGFARIRLEGEIYELDPLPLLPRRASYPMEILIDRLILHKDKRQRVSDSLELASKRGRGIIGVVRLGGGEKVFTETLRCISCDRVLPEPTPSLLSFHHPAGACPACKGLGYLEPDVSRTARRKSALKAEEHHRAGMEDVDSPDTPDEAGPPESHCPHCHGSRLNEAARSVLLGGTAIHEVSALPLPEVRSWITRLELSPTQNQIADRPRREILYRLRNLEELGLDYLTLNRSAMTLSGGEAQRIRLAHQISAPLSGILYVLDEPSVGLHPRDHQRLIDILLRLRDSDNTVIVVEHDKDTILQADFVVDMGPGAGIQGGEVLFAGTPQSLMEQAGSLTGHYLSGSRRIPIPPRRKPSLENALHLVGARGHNLKGITAHFPLGCITCVTGVSGSGKSTLVLHTLHRALAHSLHGSTAVPAPYDRLENAEHIDKVILVDQSPLGRTPRSTPATYSGIFGLIRQVFSQLPESRARGYSPNRFSFNAKGGRCETCKGEGLQKIEMLFLPDVYITCPICVGSRYKAETLQIRFKGKSIAEVLEMTIHEATAFFENFPAIRHKLEMFLEVGLGYLELGQPATTLSGGEAQRVKLAAELSRKALGKTLYILDEPTTGLHFEDIQKLLHVLQRLVGLGHTVILIEHHSDVIKTADYVIDLGPEGGKEGGYIVAEGTPEELAGVESSFTGQYLRRVLT